MSAGRSASYLLISLVSTVVLFAVFTVITRIPALSRYSYDIGYGWQTDKPAAAPAGQCDRALTTKGFPATTQRPDKDDPAGCLDQTNPLAKDINLALCFAAAAITAVAEVEVIRSMNP